MASKLSERSQPYLVAIPLAAGTSSSDVASTLLDLQELGYDSVRFVGSVAAVVGAGFNMTAQVGNTTSDFSNALVGSSALTAATSVANTLASLDLKRVQHRYARVTYNCSTASVFGGITAHPYDHRTGAVTASTDMTQEITAVQPTS